MAEIFAYCFNNVTCVYNSADSQQAFNKTCENMNVREKHYLFEPLKVWILSWIVLKDYPIPDLGKVNSEACIFHGYKSAFLKL